MFFSCLSSFPLGGYLWIWNLLLSGPDLLPTAEKCILIIRLAKTHPHFQIKVEVQWQSQGSFVTPKRLAVKALKWWLLVETLQAGRVGIRCNAVTIPSHSLDEHVAREILQFGLWRVILGELLDQSSMAQKGRGKADKPLKAAFHYNSLEKKRLFLWIRQKLRGHKQFVMPNSWVLYFTEHLRKRVSLEIERIWKKKLVECNSYYRLYQEADASCQFWDVGNNLSSGP